MTTRTDTLRFLDLLERTHRHDPEVAEYLLGIYTRVHEEGQTGIRLKLRGTINECVIYSSHTRFSDSRWRNLNNLLNREVRDMNRDERERIATGSATGPF